MFEKIWAMSPDLRSAVTLWKVNDNRFIRPSEPKPPKEVKVVGSKDRLYYEGTELDCDIYKGVVTIDHPLDDNVPQVVLDYMNYLNTSKLILAHVKETIDAIVQQSRELLETSENIAESDGVSGSSENKNEQG